MYLPNHILSCMQTLEQAGYAAYVVGGCVRDACMGLSPHDYDMCTNALPDEIEAVFSHKRMFLAGKKHGTISIVTDDDVVEITTFRTEGGYRDNRHPDWVEFVPEIEKDLARRDFTINAMAYSPTRGLVDPFGGREDLANNRLRAVGSATERFGEDSLRILRGVRFAVRYGMTVETETEKAMEAQAPLMDNLARERVFSELCKILPLVTAEDLRRFAPVLTQVIPELKPMLGFDQKNPHHSHDLYNHTARVVAEVPPDLTLRWAALLHDVGKQKCFTIDENGIGHFYGHAAIGAEMADGILRRLKAPTALREAVMTLVEHHMTLLEPRKKILRRRLSTLGWDTVTGLLELQAADMGGKNAGADDERLEAVRQVLQEIRQENTCLSLKNLAVNGHDMMALGYSGKAVGHRLNALLELVLDDKLENSREVLLEAAAILPDRETQEERQ